jgi:hypothetical protein
MKKKKIKKFKKFIYEQLSISNMELGLDLTNIHTDDYILKKTIDYIKENKNE